MHNQLALLLLLGSTSGALLLAQSGAPVSSDLKSASAKTEQSRVAGSNANSALFDADFLLRIGKYKAAAELYQTDKPSAQPTHQKPRTGPRDRYIAPEMQNFSKVFRFGHDLLIPTKVGDASFKLFLIDTGAFSNLMSPEAAREVTKVRSDSRTIVRGLSGTVNDVSRADKAVLQFSHYRQENQDILTIDLSKLSHNTGTEVSGMLGLPHFGSWK